MHGCRNVYWCARACIAGHNTARLSEALSSHIITTVVKTDCMVKVLETRQVTTSQALQWSDELAMLSILQLAQPPDADGCCG
jgi:hypothetical protein